MQVVSLCTGARPPRDAKVGLGFAVEMDFKECRSKTLVEKVRRGGVPRRSKKLFEIKGVVLPSSEVSQSPADWSAEVHRQFSGKWGCHDSQGKMNILNAVLAQEDHGLPVCDADLQQAFQVIRRRSRLDHYGVSVAAFQIIADARPGLIASSLQTAIASTPIMSSIVVRGRVYGKESCNTAANSMRAILPQPAVMQVLDVLLPMTIAKFLVGVLPPSSDCFVGACQGHSALM